MIIGRSFSRRKWYAVCAGDFGILVAALAATAAVTLGAARVKNGPAGQAEITAPGGWTRRLPLGGVGAAEVPGPLGTTRVEVAGGRARIAASPCPRGLCVSRGWIGPSPGELLVCVPNGVVVRLAGGGPAEVDARTR